MTEELPQRLIDAQDEIAAIHKANALQELIGKFYSKHEGTGYSTRLRRIFLNDNQEVTVEDYHRPHNRSEFNFKTYVITEAATMQNNYEYCELEGKVFYDILDMFLNFKPINSLVVIKQGAVIELLKTQNREKEKKIGELNDVKYKLEDKFQDIINTFGAFSYTKTNDDKKLLDNIKRIVGITGEN